MRRSDRGFTLIETLITTAIMVSGLVAVATVFSYSVATNLTNQQRTAGTMLLYEKMEIFKATSLSNSMWTVGGNLTPASPATGYFD
jgi:prepilin-type N-terminal cleavage/methylation domain-containing protein